MKRGRVTDDLLRRLLRNPKAWPVALLVVVLAFFARNRASNDGPNARPSDSGAASPDHGLYDGRSFEVIRVLDGDTFDIQAADPTTGKSWTRVRLLGVDTPEVGRDGDPSMHFGPEALAFTKRLALHRNVRVELPQKRSRGNYGRLLAYAYLEHDETPINELLVLEGMAYADTRFPHPASVRFGQVESRARANGAGLWHEIRIHDMPRWRQRAEKRP